MMKTTLLLICLLALTITGMAHELRKKAETNPLDCAYYLLINNKLNGTGGHSLTNAFFDVGRFDDALLAEKNNGKEDYSQYYALRGLSSKLLQANNKKEEAIKYISTAYDIYIENEDKWSHEALGPFLSLLIQVERADDAFRIVEGYQGFDEEETRKQKAELLLEITHAYLNTNDRVNALQVLEKASSLISKHSTEDSLDYDYIDNLIRIAIYYKRIGNRGKAVEILDRLRKYALTRSYESEQDHILLRILYQYFDLGYEKQGMEVWNKINEKKSASSLLTLSAALIKIRKTADAEKILDKITRRNLNEQSVGPKIVTRWLMLGNTKAAVKTAKAISSKNDNNYDQQEALKLVTDFFFENGEKDKAAEILDLAFKSVRKKVYKHQPDHRLGTSPAGQKAYYLSYIAKRLLELGKIEQAYIAATSIDEKHPEAQLSLALNLVRFAKISVNVLPADRIRNMAVQANKIADEQKVEHFTILIRSLSAEVLALIDETKEAADMLSDLIGSNTGKSYEGYALIAAGEVFENYRLPATPKMRRSLAAVLDRHAL